MLLLLVIVDRADMKNSCDDIRDLKVFFVVSHFHRLVLEIGAVVQVAENLVVGQPLELLVTSFGSPQHFQRLLELSPDSQSMSHVNLACVYFLLLQPTHILMVWS